MTPLPPTGLHPPPPHLPTSSPAAGLLALSQAALASSHPLAHAAAAAAAKEEMRNIEAGWFDCMTWVKKFLELFFILFELSLINGELKHENLLFCIVFVTT